MENLARQIIRASFSQGHMLYLVSDTIIVYTAKDAKDKKVIDSFVWLAAMRV